MATGYEWLSAGGQPWAWIGAGACFTFVRALDVDEVVRRIGLRAARWVEFADAEDLVDALGVDGSVVALIALGEWTLCFQANGIPDDVALKVASLVSGPEVVSVFWDVERDNSFSYWDGGHELVSFDGQYPDERFGDEPDLLADEMAGLGLSEEIIDSDFRESMLALAERVTGVPLPGDFWRRPVVLADVRG